MLKVSEALTLLPVAAVVCPVPGGSDGPSGVLICSENYITYKNFGDQPDIRCPIPRRRVSAECSELRSGTLTAAQRWNGWV